MVSGATGAPSPDVTAAIEVRDFELQPATVSVSGSVLSIAVANAGPTVHNVSVRDGAGTVLFGTRDLREGESQTVAHAIAPGTYVLFCSLPGHESLGIKGTLTVTAP
jgi:plastocyanin